MVLRKECSKIFDLNVNEYTLRIVTKNKRSKDYIEARYKEFVVNEPISVPDLQIRFYNYSFFLTIIFKILIHIFRHKFGSKTFESEFLFYTDTRKKKFNIELPREYVDEAFDNILRIIFASFCSTKNMVLIHGSSIIIKNKLVVFIGPSGAGKTTIARLGGYQIFHDDLLLITRKDENSFLFNTIPFKPPFSKKEFKGEIAAIFYIKKSEKDYIEEVCPGEKLLYLLQSLWTFEALPGKYHNNNLQINLITGILHNCDLKVIHFTKSNEIYKIMSIN